jgi:short-subunit dehydrogenase
MSLDLLPGKKNVTSVSYNEPYLLQLTLLNRHEKTLLSLLTNLTTRFLPKYMSCFIYICRHIIRPCLISSLQIHRRKDIQRKTALITGASSGIGKEITRILLKKNYHLVLVARNQPNMEKLKAELLNEDPTTMVEIVPQDLSIPYASKNIFATTQQKGIHVDLLVNNAGIGMYGALIDSNIEDLNKLLQINTHALSELCHFYGREMVKKSSGAILNIASMAAYQPVPFISAYAASKAYVLNFTEALSIELKRHGVGVTCYAPGHTDTDFFSQANIPLQHSFYGKHSRVPASLVAKDAINALLAKKTTRIYGFKNRLLTCLSKLLPRKTVLLISHRLVTQKGENFG